jgi:hypothetical protein
MRCTGQWHSSTISGVIKKRKTCKRKIDNEAFLMLQGSQPLIKEIGANTDKHGMAENADLRAEFLAFLTDKQTTILNNEDYLSSIGSISRIVNVPGFGVGRG